MADTAPTVVAAFKQKARKDKNVRKTTLSFDAEELLEEQTAPQGNRAQSSPPSISAHNNDERKEDEQPSAVRRPLSPITRLPQRGVLASVAEQDDDDAAAMQAVADMHERRQKRQQQQRRRPASQLSSTTTTTTRTHRPLQSVTVIGDGDYHTADTSDEQQQQQDTTGGEYSAERLAALKLNAIHIGATDTTQSAQRTHIDVEDDDDGDDDHDSSNAMSDHQQRLVRAAKAQRARQRTITQHNPDYIPLTTTTTTTTASRNDPIRIDDDDNSDSALGRPRLGLGRTYAAAEEEEDEAGHGGTLMREDDEDDVVDMTMEAREVKEEDRLLFGDDGKAKRKEKTRQEIEDTLKRERRERRKSSSRERGGERKEIDVEVEGGGVDSEMEEWEEEQLRKGGGVRVGERIASAPLPHQRSTSRTRSVERDTAPPPVASPQLSLASLSLASLQSSLQSSLSALHHTTTATQSSLASLTTRLTTTTTTLTTLTAQLDTLNDHYQHYQHEREYVTTLSSLLAEKVSDVDDAWREAASQRRKAGEERQARMVQYRRDEREETGLCVAGSSGGGVVVELDEFGRDLGYVREMDRERRDGIRTAVRTLLQQRRDPAAISERALDGWVTEDEAYDEVEGVAALQENARVSLVDDVRAIMADVDDEWRTVERVITHFQHWQRRDPKSFNDAYVSLTLPKLLAPYVRIELMLQAPLQPDGQSTCERLLRQLLSAVAEQTGDGVSVEKQLGADLVVPWLCDVMRWEWDVRSSTQTERLRQLLTRFFRTLSSADRSSAWYNAQWQRLLSAFCERLQAEVDEWQPMMTAGGGSAAVSDQQLRAIVRECVRGAKLLSAVYEWDRLWFSGDTPTASSVGKLGANDRLLEVRNKQRSNVSADLRVLSAQLLMRGRHESLVQDIETCALEVAQERSQGGSVNELLDYLHAAQEAVK